MYYLTSFLENSLQFFDSFIGVVIFIFIYALWVTFLLPGLWISMLGGVLYGPFFGTIFVFIGACLGAELTFILSRNFFRNWSNQKIANFPKFQTIQKAVTKQGLKLIFLTRLSPAFPFALLNLFYGVSEVSWRDFSLGLLAILPGTIFYSSLGSIAGDVAKFDDVLMSGNSIASQALGWIGLLATLALVVLISKVAKEALQEEDLSI